MKLLLVMPDYGQQRHYYISLGMMYISSYLKQKGYDVDCLNQNHYPASKLSDILKATTYDAIGTGGLFVHIAQIRSIIQTVRELNPQARVFLGGAIASADPDLILSELKPDFLVIGEGERTADFLLNAVVQQKDLNQVTGIAFMEHDRVVKTAPTPLIEDLDDVPFPDYEGFEYGYYLDHYSSNLQHLSSLVSDTSKIRLGYLVSSRDCVCRCTFCFRLTGGNYRVRSISNLLADIRYLIDKYQVNHIALCDEMFITTKERLAEACKALKSVGLPWYCQARVSSLDDEVLAMMKDAGCHLLSLGFESGSPVVLKSMKKGITPQQIERAIHGCIKAKLTIQGNFISGDPAETLETMEETIRFIRKFKKIDLGFGGTIAAYPGTELYFNLIKSGKLTDRLAHHNTPEGVLWNMTQLSDIDYDYLFKKIKFENYRRLSLQYAKVRVLRREADGRHVLDIRCHFCGGLNENCLLDLGQPAAERIWIVCKHCFQRTFIDRSDLRFLDLKTAMYEIYYLYIVRWMVVSPLAYRILYPVRAAGILIKAMLRIGDW